MNPKKQIAVILTRLKKVYPGPKTCLAHDNPLELLVATILSAQTTDVHVNKVTGLLFRKYRSARDYADADPDEFRRDVSSVNFYNNKAKNIQASARQIITSFGGIVPKTMEELVTLPGVARKTANIILSDGYGIIEGIAVDTHVMRLSGRLGLSGQHDPVKIEQDLMKHTPKTSWNLLSHLLILHGRQVCQARKPRHPECVLRDICPSGDV